MTSASAGPSAGAPGQVATPSSAMTGTAPLRRAAKLPNATRERCAAQAAQDGIRWRHPTRPRPATGLTDAGRGLVGWRQLMPSCAACAAHRSLVAFGSFAARLSGAVPVTADEGAATWPGAPADGPADADVIAALGAEITLVHARLDHLQAQLSRLEGGPSGAGSG